MNTYIGLSRPGEIIIIMVWSFMFHSQVYTVKNAESVVSCALGGRICLSIHISKSTSMYLYVGILLEMWCDDHTVNWCEQSATGVTPRFGVMFSLVK